ncbi:MAG TPA: hypothetical protein VEX68_30055 [Bryobacteraceae bacterium]|nr:hypothetical protein [Bryobacteraceae bacterium]
MLAVSLYWFAQAGAVDLATLRYIEPQRGTGATARWPEIYRPLHGATSRRHEVRLIPAASDIILPVANFESKVMAPAKAVPQAAVGMQTDDQWIADIYPRWTGRSAGLHHRQRRAQQCIGAGSSPIFFNHKDNQ